MSYLKKHNDFIENDAEWKKDNNARTCVMNYTLLASEFRVYWESMRSGDRLSQEIVENKWLCIFSALNKHKHVDIVLTGIEKQCQEINYSNLETIRRNSCIRCNTGEDVDGRKFNFVAADECMENVNAWTKKLPLGNTQESWMQHSKNLVFSRQCINFEEEQYKRK